MVSDPETETVPVSFGSSPPVSLPRPAGTGPRAVRVRYRQAVLDRSADDLADLHAADAVHEFPFAFPGLPALPRARGGARRVPALWGRESGPAGADRRVRRPRHRRSRGDRRGAERRRDARPRRAAFAVPGPLVLRVRDGLPVHVRDYMDAAAAARPTGRTRTDGSGPVAPGPPRRVRPRPHRAATSGAHPPTGHLRTTPTDRSPPGQTRPLTPRRRPPSAQPTDGRRQPPPARDRRACQGRQRHPTHSRRRQPPHDRRPPAA